MTTVTITCTDTQAECITRALELYFRLGLGQFEEVTYLCRTKQIRGRYGELTNEQCDTIDVFCDQIKMELGHSPNGWFGIGNPKLHPMTQRAFEIKKQIDKARAEHRDPNPSPGYRGVNYDGRIVRYTEDPDITVSISNAAQCEWTEDADAAWHSSCGRAWQFDDGASPSAHKVQFCHGCGKLVQEHQFSEIKE